MALKITMLNGSPRPRGVMARILEVFTEGLKSAGEVEVETLLASRLGVASCMHCDSCIKTGVCVIKDDAQNVFEKMMDSDLMVVGSPVYFAGVPGACKSLIDRAQVEWNRRYVRKEKIPVRAKRALMLSSCGSKKANMSDGIALTLFYFFDALGVRFNRETDSITFHRKETPSDVTAEDAARIRAFGRDAVSALLFITGGRETKE